MSWTVVFSSSQPHLIEIVKNLLSEQEIQFVTIDKRDSMYGSISNAGIEVYIQSEDYVKSKNLLKQIESE